MRKRGCFYSLNTCIIHRKCSSMNMNMIIKNKREDAIILAFWTGFGNHEVVGPCCYLWHVSEISQVGPQSTMILSSIYRLTLDRVCSSLWAWKRSLWENRCQRACQGADPYTEHHLSDPKIRWKCCQVRERCSEFSLQRRARLIKAWHKWRLGRFWMW